MPKGKGAQVQIKQIGEMLDDGHIKAPDAIMAAQAELLRGAQTSADRARNLTPALVMCIGCFIPFGTYLQNCRRGFYVKHFCAACFFYGICAFFAYLWLHNSKYGQIGHHR